MVWFVEGNGELLQIGVSDSGLPSISGQATKHEPKAAGGDSNFEFYRRLESAECAWSIHTTQESELHLDPAGNGFYKRIQKNPERSLASIQFHSDPDLVGIEIALPINTFEYVMNIFQNVLVHQNLSYLITLDFLGFRVPEGDTETPSIQEFLLGPLDGKAYFSEEISFLSKRSTANA